MKLSFDSLNCVGRFREAIGESARCRFLRPAVRTLGDRHCGWAPIQKSYCCSLSKFLKPGALLLHFLVQTAETLVTRPVQELFATGIH